MALDRFVIMLSFANKPCMLSVVMLNVVMLSVVSLNVVMSVVAPCTHALMQCFKMH
jgi:hypothetical protein